MQLLKQLYNVFSPSGKEGAMQEFLLSYLSSMDGVSVHCDDTGNIYATKGVCDTYPCIAAHMDQVQRNHSSDFKVFETVENGRTVLFGYSFSSHRLEGLGADDKNGIWVALRMLGETEFLKCVFFVGEETGCTGSSAADLGFFSDCRFVCQVDRRGNSDFITCISSDLCSDEFINDARPSDFGYEEQSGACTDVQALRDGGLELSCCNVSCGYYNPHTDYETTVWEDLLKCLAFVRGIVAGCTSTYPKECSRGFWWRDDWYFYGQWRRMDREWAIDDAIMSLIEDCEGNVTFEQVWREIRTQAIEAKVPRKRCKEMFAVNMSDYMWNAPVCCEGTAVPGDDTARIG